MKVLLTARQLVLRQAQSLIRVPDFTWHDEQRLFLRGASGCGKTSFLHALLGFVPVHSGDLQLLGRERRVEKDFHELRGRLGLLFQHPGDQLLGPSVLEDICFGPLNLGVPLETARQQAAVWLERLEIGHLRERGIAELSGGEQQRVALAGLLVMHPEALLLDEPCTGLDPKSREVVLACLEQCGIPMLVASHDASLIERLASRVVDFQEAES